jgi:polyhydroxybutyrate depolymerase
MKVRFTILSILCLPFLLVSQQTIDGSITHDNLEREYILYVPANYTGDEAVPLVFNFHGLGSNATEQMFYGEFRPIADTAGFLVVHPEGTVYQNQQHWNVGGFTTGSTVDDVGFTEALLDHLAANYNIDLSRVYSTGMSNGGYMSFLLACQLSDKIAAIASVTGSMTPETFDNCDPQHPTPAMQIHGTTDFVVPYDGSSFSKSIDEVLQYWVDYNNCDPNPSVTMVPDVNAFDGSTAEHFVYADGDLDVTTEHFKVTGGGHTWPGTFLPLPGTNLDFDASLEIWKFFSRYDLDDLTLPSSSTEQLEQSLSVYPNPTTGSITLESKDAIGERFEVFSPQGQLLRTGVINSSQQLIDFSDLPPNLYLLKSGSMVVKVMKAQ